MGLYPPGAAGSFLRSWVRLFFLDLPPRAEELCNRKVVPARDRPDLSGSRALRVSLK